MTSPLSPALSYPWTARESWEAIRFARPLLGNGNMATRMGGPGYHRDAGAHEEEFIAWAARRLGGPYYPLIRLGRLVREIEIDGDDATAAPFDAEMDYRAGLYRALTSHESGVQEETESFIHHDANTLFARTTLGNNSSDTRTVRFRVRYLPGDHLGDWRGATVHRCGDHVGNVEYRGPAAIVGVMLRADWGEWQQEDEGHRWRIEREWAIAPGESVSLCTTLTLGDAREFTHPPKPEQLEDRARQHREAWAEFWDRGWVEFDDPDLVLLWRTCLYAIRCSCTWWSVPPSVGPYWDARAFHDETFPFLGLASTGHFHLAERIPEYRLRILPKAVERGVGRGAQYPWETTEDGLDGTPFGGHQDEHFHMGNIAESAAQWAVYSPHADTLARFYPLWRECAEYFRLNLVREDGNHVRLRPVTDFDEGVYPDPNPIYTLAAAIRVFRLAADAAERLDVAGAPVAEWRRLADGLYATVSRDPGGRFYDTGLENHYHKAVVGMIFPFRADVDSNTARGTLDRFRELCRSTHNWKPGTIPPEDRSNWIWSTAQLAAGYALQGRGEEATEVLRLAPSSASPFSAPNEWMRPDHHSIPWFTTSAGVLVFAVNALFLQVEPGRTRICPAVTEGWRDYRFQLGGHGGVRVACAVEGGKVTVLQAESPKEQDWVYVLEGQERTAALKPGWNRIL